MGIKFKCPNGHKLNVKSFLAGRKGSCPKCGAKVNIPADVEAQASGERLAAAGTKSGLGSASGAGPSFGAGGVPLSVLAAAGAPAPMRSGPAGNMTGMAVASPGGISSGMSPGLGVAAGYPSAVSSAGAPPTAAADPLVASPQARWFVRPPSGGQFGPAPADLFRKWIGEGRVSADSHIWREGWPEWQLAGQVLPTYFPPAMSAGTLPPAISGMSVSSPPPMPLAAAPLLSPMPEVNLATAAKIQPAISPRRRQQVQGMNPWMMILLLVIFLVLAGLLVFLLYKFSQEGRGSSETESSARRTAPLVARALLA